MAIPRKGNAEYLGGTKIKFIWPCGHYRIEDYSKKPIPKRMGVAGCKMMAKYWDKDRGGHVYLPPCPTCEKHLIKPKRIKVGGRVKDHIR